MATPNYKQIAELLAIRAPFNHSGTLTAYREGDEYRVLSYSTLIATYNLMDGTWWINPTKYSVTTSKQQGIIRRVAKLDGWTEPLI